MLRNQHRDYMNAGMPPYEPRIQPLPPVSQLDAKDERLVEQSQLIGRLQGQNDLLNEDNVRLEQDNAEIKRENANLAKHNRELEEQEARATAAHRSAESVIDEFVQELKNRTITKETK
jgi:hypothetical protein